jgi:hypothetical protein
VLNPLYHLGVPLVPASEAIPASLHAIVVEAATAVPNNPGSTISPLPLRIVLAHVVASDLLFVADEAHRIQMIFGSFALESHGTVHN